MENIPDELRDFVIHGNSEQQREVQGLQNDLIHISVAYHLDRLRHGHAVMLHNVFHEPEGEKRPNPGVLKRDIQERGPLAKEPVRQAVEAGETSPISYVQSGVLASMWDSLNQVLRVDREGGDARYKSFLTDSDVQNIISQADQLGSDHWSFQGSSTIHSGLRVGLNNISSLVEMEYALHDDNESFDASRLAHMIAKSDSVGLTCLGMDSMMVYLNPKEGLNQWSDPDSKIGIPYEKLQGYLKSNELGCSARGKISERAYDIIGRHDMNHGPYEKPPTSAIKVVANTYKEHAFAEWDSLQDLSEEQKLRLDPYNRYMLFSELRG